MPHVSSLIRYGIFLNPMGTKLYLSTEHTTDHRDRLAVAFRTALIHDHPVRQTSESYQHSQTR